MYWYSISYREKSWLNCKNHYHVLQISNPCFVATEVKGITCKFKQMVSFNMKQIALKCMMLELNKHQTTHRCDRNNLPDR